MKTRRKIVKSPTKGRRRTSIICVKKSPLPRKNARKNVRVLAKNKPRLQTYESPLKSLYFNGPSNSSASRSQPSTSKVQSSPSVKKELNLKKELETSVNIVEMPRIPIDLGKVKSPKEDVDSGDENKEEDNLSVMSLHSNNSIKSKSKKRSLLSLIAAGETPNRKKRKLKKSPLSKINEYEENPINSLSESVIIVDDDSKPATPIKCTSSVTKLSSNPETTSKTIRSMTKSEDIVIIDCNDSLLTEMEQFHEAMNTSDESENRKFSDSIIVIDHDDDPPPAEPQPSTSKLNDDCCVVWSSLPQPSTSAHQSGQNILSNRPSQSIQAVILKSDKIMLDTSGNFSNLRILDNDSVPSNKPVAIRATTKTTLASTDEGKKTKSLVKSPKASKIATKATKKTTSMVTKKTTVTKRSTKSNGDLIFAAKTDDNKTVPAKKRKGQLREIVIDGCNVAMAYTNNKTFDERGIKMCIDYFVKRGHSVKVFVPQHKRAVRHPLLEKWHSEGIAVFTPSRKLGNKNFTPYDDRYILGYATECNGIVVSQDQFRDLYNEKPEFRDTIENRLLVPTFVGDYVMFPEDPLGRNGPALKDFLKH